MDLSKKSPNTSGSPEKRPQDKERLRQVGDLLIDVSTLIEALNTFHQADQIDYDLTFPVLPGSPIQIPEVFTPKDPDYITITAGKTKLDAREDENGMFLPSQIATHLSVEIIAGKDTLMITRESNDDDTEGDDIILNTTQNNPNVALRDELRGETSADFEKRLTSVNKVSKAEVNSLLMSLAIPDNQEFSHFADKDLLELNTFTYLIEALSIKALEASSKGIYMFQKSETELTFEKKDGDESFTIAFVNPLTNQAIIAVADTRTGFDLKFSIFSDGRLTPISPTSEEIEFVHNLIREELAEVTKTTDNIDSHHLIQPNNPEDIAVKIVEASDRLELELFQHEIDNVLDQDGFDTPNSGAA